jgi:hypothetical protein
MRRVVFILVRCHATLKDALNDKAVLGVFDGYRSRFERLRAAQQRYAAEHDTTEFDPGDPCCTARWAAPPRRVPDHELRKARRSLGDAVYRFLVRCCNDRFITESFLRETCRGLGLGVEASDLRNRT